MSFGHKALVPITVAISLAMAVCSPMGAVSASRATSSPRGDTGATYVAMGDSYASGVGLPGPGPDPWISTTGSPGLSKDGCDRSPLAYPMLVARAEGYSSSFRFVACSGATTGSTDDGSSFTTGGSLLKGSDGEAPQYDALSPSSTKVVSLTVGGDDIGFAPLLASCTGVKLQEGPLSYVIPSVADYSKPGVCARTLSLAQAIATAAPSAAPSLEGALYSTYSQILATAPLATLYVLTYPQLFSGTTTSTFCPLTGAEKLGPLVAYIGLTTANVTAFNRLEGDVNSDIEQAAQQINLTASSSRVVVVNVNALTAGDGQTCNTKTLSKSSINGILFAPGHSLSTVYAKCLHGPVTSILACVKTPQAAFANSIASGSMHPKAAGQALMAKALEAAITSTSPSNIP